jgi:3-methyladenine DNA glycosylase AlkD
MTIDEVLILIKEKTNPTYLAGMKRFGIDTQYALGIPIPEMRKTGKATTKYYALAPAFWKTNYH